LLALPQCLEIILLLSHSSLLFELIVSQLLFVELFFCICRY
jgi:hypothetical protein